MGGRVRAQSRQQSCRKNATELTISGMEYLIGSLTSCWTALGPLKSFLPSYCTFLPEVEVGGRKFNVVKLVSPVCESALSLAAPPEKANQTS